MSHSDTLFDRASLSIPGGVNSPVRAFKGVGGSPVFIERAEGAYLVDVDSNRYIDYVGSWGPMILGHAPKEITAAVSRQLQNGLSYGAPTELETKLAEKLCELMPSLDMVRMVNSGTEATMSAIRLARGFTGRDRLIKFEGCYHGHADSLLVKAGSGALTLGVPTSPGVPAAVAEATTTLEFNNIDELQAAFASFGDEVACVIVEPVAGNMNLIPPRPGFLQALRDLCSRHGAVLIFDEVMTGFRVGLGGAQERYDITPDLTTLGKVIGGGLPVGAFGGKADIMAHLAPLGPVYQAGTLSGNPLAMAAGLATLDIISTPGFYAPLIERTEQLLTGLNESAARHGIPFTTNQAGTMFGLFFTADEQVDNFAATTACNIEQFRSFFHGMLKAGVYLAPSAYEAGFVSACHDSQVIDTTLEAADQVFAKLT